MLSIRVGDDDVGVRVDDATTLEALRGRLHEVGGGPAAPVRYSVRVGTGATRATSALAVLYRGSTIVVRSRSRARVLTALALQLDAHRAPPRGLLHVDVLAAVAANGNAVVVPRPADACTFDRRLARYGLRVVDGPVLVDARTGLLVVRPPSFDLTDLVADSDAVDDAPAPTGSYPVVAWAVPDAESQAARCAYLAASARWRDDDPGLDLVKALAASVVLVDQMDGSPQARAEWMTAVAADPVSRAGSPALRRRGRRT
jgi:hypothetical protein